MPDDELTTTLHSLLHKAGDAMCSQDWSEMTGDDAMRTCGQCGAVAYQVERMDPAIFCSEAEKFRPDTGPLRAYRRLDGTYTFTDRNCSPKEMLSPLKSDLRAVMISNWWSDRYGRYNKYLALYGMAAGGTATFLLLFMPGGGIGIVYFVLCAAISAIAANLIFAGCCVLNLLVPGFLAPLRQWAGPLLLMASMGLLGFYMTVPLLYVGYALIVQLFHR